MNSIFDIYPNKRDLFYKILKYKNGIFGISGTRQIGKTVLLKQLSEYLDGIYISADKYLLTDITIEESKGIYDEFIKAVNSDKTIICLDEITLLNKSHFTAMYSIMRNLFDDKLFIFTGSYAPDIENIIIRGCKGRVLYLYDLSFAEFCRWNNITQPSYTDMLNYFKFSIVPFMSNDIYDNIINMKTYMSSMISCIKKSWSKRSYNTEPVNSFLNNSYAVNSLIDYIREMCEFTVVKQSNGRHLKSIKHPNEFIADINMTPNDIERFKLGNFIMTGDGKHYDDYKSFKIKYADSIKEFLRSTKLAFNLYDLEVVDDTIIHRLNENSLISSMPWMMTVYNDTFHENITETRMYLLLEYYFMLLSIELNYNTGQLRLNNDYEIDVVGIDSFGFRKPLLIECKDRPSSKLTDEVLKRYAFICKKVNLNEFFITSIDSSIDKTISLDGFIVTAKIRKSFELLYELSKGIYCSDVYSKNVNSNNGETNFDWSTNEIS